MLKDSKQKNLSDIVQNYLSGHIQSEEDYKMFVNFVEAFYEWLEYQDETKRITSQRPSIKDLDYALDEFVDYWHRLVAEHLPTVLQVDRRFLLKHMKEVYQAKGTEKSYKLLFRILFNETIDIRYPGESLLIPSSAIWRELIRIDLRDEGQDIFNTEFSVMEGQTSEATGIVEKVQRITSGGVRVFRVDYSVESKEGDFQIGEYIEFENGDSLEVLDISDPVGEFIGEKGLLNTTGATLQDGNFYQLYSYVIESNVPDPEIEDELLSALNIDVWSWRDIVRKILHPAGMKLFSSLRITGSVDAQGVKDISFHTFVNLVLSLIVNMAKDGQSFDIYQFIEITSLMNSTQHEELDSNGNRVGSARVGLPKDHLENNNDRWLPFDAGVKDHGKAVSDYNDMPVPSEKDPLTVNGINYRKNTFHAVHMETPRSTPEAHIELYVPDLQDILTGKHNAKRLKINLDARIYKRQFLTVLNYQLVSSSPTKTKDYGYITDSPSDENDYLSIGLEKKTDADGIVYYVETA